MSSMRNAVQRRSHRERAQPTERKRLGLLEKHKDYKLRAQDHNRKKEKLKALRQKAADRNEDEFYFGMLSRDGPGSRHGQGKRWKGTVAGDRGNRSLDVDVVRLLKTQDIGYVRTMRSTTAKQVLKLREQVVFASEGMPVEDDEDDDEEFDFGAGPVTAKAKKIVFVERGDEAPLPEEEDDDDDDEEEGAGAEFKGFEDRVDGESEAAEKLRRERNLARLKRDLADAETKLKALTTAERELEVQQAKMAKTATSGGT
ncbi:small-subunit processome, partial [Plectosphaerella plurivora]